MHGGIGVQHLRLGSGVGAFVMERYPRHVEIRVLVFMICYYCIFSLVCCTDILCMACDSVRGAQPYWRLVYQIKYLFIVMLITSGVIQVGLVGQLIKKRLRFDRLVVELV